MSYEALETGEKQKATSLMRQLKFWLHHLRRASNNIQNIATSHACPFYTEVCHISCMPVLCWSWPLLNMPILHRRLPRWPILQRGLPHIKCPHLSKRLPHFKDAHLPRRLPHFKCAHFTHMIAIFHMCPFYPEDCHISSGPIYPEDCHISTVPFLYKRLLPFRYAHSTQKIATF